MRDEIIQVHEWGYIYSQKTVSLYAYLDISLSLSLSFSLSLSLFLVSSLKIDVHADIDVDVNTRGRAKQVGRNEKKMACHVLVLVVSRFLVSFSPDSPAASSL